MRRSGNRVRITAQLLDASNGYHLFSETYDRTVEDIFATQDEISETIVGALAPALGGEGHETSSRPSEVISTEAHREYLKGLFHWARWTPEGVREAIAHFERASEIDPDAALPHSGLATCYSFLGFTGQAPYDSCYPQARRHAETALALDASLGEAHVSLAMVGLFGEWDFDGAYAHFQKALSMTPGAAGVHHMYALYLLAAGETEAALQAIETAVDLDPLSLMMQQNLGWAYQAAGRPEEGVRVLQGVLDKDPHFRSALESLGWIRVSQGRLDEATELFETLHRRLGDPLKGVADLGYVYGVQGRTEEAREMLRRLEQRRKRDPHVTLSVDFAAVHAGLGEVDEAVRHLREARDQHMAAVLMLPSFPPWNGLMDHPGLVEMYREIGRPV